MKGTDGINYNTDRILRVTVYKEGGGHVVIEYCPYDRPTIAAKIDATIKIWPVTQPKNNKPGNLAKVKIFFPPENLISLIDTYTNWAIGYTNAQPYYKTRCRVRVEAGYWDRDLAARSKNPSPTETSRNGVERKKTDDEIAAEKRNKGRVYKQVFEGWLNTSSFYRKGTDDILELYAHNIELTTTEISKLNSKLVDNGVLKKIYTATVQGESTAKVQGTAQKSWQTLAHEIITRFDPQSVKPTAKGTLDRTMEMGYTPIPGTENKETQPNFKMHFIFPPKDRDKPWVDAQSDPFLEEAVVDTKTRGIVINVHSFVGAMNEACDYLPGGIVWKPIYKKDNDGYVNHWFWRPGTMEKNTVNGWKPGTTVTIYNYQNLLEAPSVDGAGCFNIKMLFNPNVAPDGGIRLVWDDKHRSSNILSPYTQGANSTAGLGQYYPSLQAGKYNIQTRALEYQRGIKNSKGDIFGPTYRVGYITHSLSSYGSAWSTEVKTLSMIYNAGVAKK